jgi:hypothetical protein
MIGGYAQLSYGFNYYGTIGSQRDEYVILHKIEDADIKWLEEPLTDAREKAVFPVFWIAYPWLRFNIVKPSIFHPFTIGPNIFTCDRMSG